MWEPLSLCPLSCNSRAKGVTLGPLVSGAAPCPPPAMWGQWLHTARCPPKAEWKVFGCPPMSACPEHRRNSGQMWAILPTTPSPALISFHIFGAKFSFFMKSMTILELRYHKTGSSLFSAMITFHNIKRAGVLFIPPC